MGDVHMEVIEVTRTQLAKGMWLMPPYDHETGLTPDGEPPIPERIHSIIHQTNPPATGVVTHEANGMKHNYVFTDADRMRIVR
jgi:hypothetical protein